VSKCLIKWTLLIVVATAFLGCVSQTERDSLQTLLRQSEEQVIELKSQLEECRARVDALQRAPRVQDPAMLNQLEQLKAERGRVISQIEALEAQIRQLAQAPVILPPEIDDALRQLAARHGDVMEYDPANGMLKLKSDLTFALGSAQVTDNAKATLGQLAEILKRVIAQDYEVRIVGHTDNVPIKRQDTLAKHPTNWYLSAHRAIAVEEVLETAGVPAVRMSAAGHGQHRPIATNGVRGNEANRRVEIYIVPNTYHATIDSATTTGGTSSSGTSGGTSEGAPEQFK
jgi:chemotaxis protein MotB